MTDALDLVTGAVSEEKYFQIVHGTINECSANLVPLDAAINRDMLQQVQRKKMKQASSHSETPYPQHLTNRDVYSRKFRISADLFFIGNLFSTCTSDGFYAFQFEVSQTLKCDHPITSQ